MKELEIYFDSKLHKYTDSYTNEYTSVTTVLSKYEDKFADKDWQIAKACERIGKNPRHPKYAKYKNKSAKAIIKGWEKESKKGCDIGNEVHDFLETSIKKASKYKTYNKSNRLFTVKELVINPMWNRGILDLDKLREYEIDVKYPEIFDIISLLVAEGFKIYSEIAVYSIDLLIAGLIDIFLIKGDKFIILDWKSNKAPIQFKSGYYEKDNNNKITGYKEMGTVFYKPISHLENSVGNKYTLQLSSYAYLAEQFGLTCIGLILCHIRHDVYESGHVRVVEKPELIGKQVVDIYNIEYLKSDIDLLYKDYVTTKQLDNKQYNMFKI